MQRQREWYWVSYAFVFCLLTQFLVACNNPTPTMVKLDPTTSYTFEGWGTSLAWWAEVVGGWPDAEKAALEKALFNPEAGLGLNIVRYNFGGVTSMTNCDPKSWRPGADIPSYLPPYAVDYNSFDPTKDPHQLKILQDAKSIIGSKAIFEGFANSAPDWMLSTTCSQGNGSANNLNSGKEPNYAQYLATIVQHFHNDFNITFHTVEPFNEPHGPWGPKDHGSQEGMSVDSNQQQKVIQYLYQDLRNNGGYTQISANDDNSIDDAVTDYSQYDTPPLSQDIHQLNTHSYQGTKLNDLYKLGQQLEKPLWMSEYTTDGTDSLGDHTCRHTDKNHTSTQDMSGALSLSCRILHDMNSMHPEVWAYWQPVEENNAYGFFQAPLSLDDPKGIFPSYTKQYDTMWQYSHFIRPGYQIIENGDANSLAAFDPASHTLVIVATNDALSNTRDITYDLSNFTPVTEPITAYTTTADTSVNATPTPQPLSFSGSGTQFIAHVPSQSITTYVIPNISMLSSGNPGTSNTTPTNVGSEWNLANDFRISPNQANSNPDSHGNANTWSFYESSSLSHDPSTYSLLPQFISNAFNIAGLEQWSSTRTGLPPDNSLPAVGVNATGSVQQPFTVTWPAGAIRVHPYTNELVVVGWKSPMTGTVAITGGVSSMDNHGGDGILWSIDKGSMNIASGSYGVGGNQQFANGKGGLSLSSVAVTVNDILYFVVDPRGSNLYDSTNLDLTIMGSPY